MPSGHGDERDIEPEWLIEDEWGWWKNVGGAGGDPWVPSQSGGGTPFELPPEIASALAMESPTEYGPRRRRRSGQAMPQERVPIPAYAWGGTHPGGQALVGEVGPEVVDLPPGSSVQPNILGLLLSLLGGRGGRPLGAAQQRFKGMPSYAYGTPDVWMQPRPRPNLQPQQAASWMPPSNPWGGVGGFQGGGRGGGGWGQDLGGRGGGPSGWQQPWAKPTRPTTRPGDVSFDSLYDPKGNTSLNQFIQGLVASGIGGGMFDVLGNQQAAEQARDYVSSMAGARERQAQLGADLDAGGDPALTSYGRTMARLNTQKDSADAYLNTLLDTGKENRARRDMLYQLLFNAVTRNDPNDNTGSDLIGLLGQLGGAAIGAIPKKK